jgi:hypothetical protein
MLVIKGAVMKILVISLVFAKLVFALDLDYNKDGASFDTVMSKNRSSKNIKGSNYVEIKSDKDLKEYKDKDIGIVVDKNNRGPVYNTVKIKNVKSKEDKYKKSEREYGMDRFSENKEERLIGVKVKEGYRGKVSNRVSIENSEIK